MFEVAEVVGTTLVELAIGHLGGDYFVGVVALVVTVAAVHQEVLADLQLPLMLVLELLVARLLLLDELVQVLLVLRLYLLLPFPVHFGGGKFVTSIYILTKIKIEKI